MGTQDGGNDFDVQVLGIDSTFTHHLNANQTLKIQGEAFHQDREKLETDFRNNLWGAYGLVDLRLHPQGSAGVRYDYVEPVDNDLSVNPRWNEVGYTGYLTFYQSEFARWRLQGSHLRFVTGENNDELLLQGTFAIGEHKHKIQ